MSHQRPRAVQDVLENILHKLRKDILTFTKVAMLLPEVKTKLQA